MPDGADGPDSAPLDELDLELLELTEGRAADPLFLEPSAAERAQAGAVRTEDVSGVPAASGAPTAPGGTRVVRPRRRRRGGQLAAALLAVILLLVAGGLVWLRLGQTAGSADAGAPPADTALGSAIRGIIAPGDLFAGSTADPFLGTPADGWADGTAGIVAPPAAPADGFTAAQVAAAYATTGELVAAASLNKQTLLGGPPAALARLLTPGQRATFQAGLGDRGAKDGRPLSTRSWVASFAPGSTALVGTVIKVSGTMTAQAVTESGRKVLRVEVSYTFVYAVAPPQDPVDWTRVTTRQEGSVDFARWNDPHGALEPWDRTVVEPVSGVGCGVADGYIHPAYPGYGPASAAGAAGAAGAEQSRLVIGPFSQGVPAASAVCASATG